MSTVSERVPILLGLGIADAAGVAGTAAENVEWSRERVDPLRSPGGFRRVFGRFDATYRRIDRVSRALVLATEAAGASRVLDERARTTTALVLETVRGCLESDVRFAAGLRQGVVLGPLFPYTLPSTCLGELALRHALRVPTLCLSTVDGGAGAAFWEARSLIEEGEASHVVVASVEVLADPRADVASALCAIAVVLGPAGSGPSLAPWPEPGANPIARLAESVLRRPVLDPRDGLR